MRAFKETLQSIRSKVTKFEPPLTRKGQVSVLSVEPNILEQSAEIVFDQAIKARNPRHLDNHLNIHNTELKIFESAPKLR